MSKVLGIKTITVNYGETIQDSDGAFKKYGVSYEVAVDNASKKEADEIYLKIQESLVGLIEKVK